MLSVNELCVTGRNHVPLLTQISLKVERGECIALTGPSGSGKTTLLRTILGIHRDGLQVEAGTVMLEGENILELSENQRRVLCRNYFGFIPQNPMTAFFRNARIGNQMMETFRLHLGADHAAAKKLAEECLRQVNLPDTDRILKAYPGQLSGGMLQRIAMAILIGTKPDYILADEPTSALDKENRALLLTLLKERQKESGILLISHDTEAMEELCSITYVLQEGKIVETQPTPLIFSQPTAAWTCAFVEAARQHRKGSGRWKRLK